MRPGACEALANEADRQEATLILKNELQDVRGGQRDIFLHKADLFVRNPKVADRLRDLLSACARQ